MDGHLERRLTSRALWSILFRGEALAVGESGDRHGTSDALWHAAMRLHDRGEVELDRIEKRVYGALGITLVPTDHEVAIGGRTTYARSADQALALFKALGESGAVHTSCPICSRRLSLFIRRGAVVGARPRLHATLCLARHNLSSRTAEANELSR